MGTKHDEMVDRELDENSIPDSPMSKNKVIEMIVDHDKRVHFLEARVSTTLSLQLLIAVLMVVLFVLIYFISQEVF
jgi:hypothetical protein